MLRTLDGFEHVVTGRARDVQVEHDDIRTRGLLVRRCLAQKRERRKPVLDDVELMRSADLLERPPAPAFGVASAQRIGWSPIAGRARP